MIDEKVIGSLERMVRLREENDCRLASILRRRSSEIVLPDRSRVAVSELLSDPSLAIAFLTTCCQRVAGGSKDYRAPCRLLDALAYGNELQKRGYRIVGLL